MYLCKLNKINQTNIFSCKSSQFTTSMTLLNILNLRWIDILDILLVATLIYELYRLVKGTNVMRIFWAIIIIIFTWLIADTLKMRLTGELLGKIVNVGLIALVVVFQPEIRKFLLIIGTKTQLGGGSILKRFKLWRNNMNQDSDRLNIEAYLQALRHMSESKTGALIIFQRLNEVEELIRTGERIEAIVSPSLLEALFFKNSPLHDGAVIVNGNRILAARCILPVTNRTDIDPNLGLRHRSAIGVTEQLDVISVIVSEETGSVSYALDGEIHHNVNLTTLRQVLEKMIQ